MFKNIEYFLALKKEQHRVNFEMTYVDIAGGDLVAGLLLSQIVYWFLPSHDGESKTRVTYKGRPALAKSRESWYDEIRITPRQYDYAIAKLKKIGVVDVVNSMFDGKRTPFIMLNEEVFLQKYEEAILHAMNNSVLTKCKNRCLQNVKTDIAKMSKPLTKTTTKTTTKTKEIDNSFFVQTNSISLTRNDDPYLHYYGLRYKDIFGEEHPPVKNIDWIKDRLYEWIWELSLGDKEVYQIIDYYLSNRKKESALIHVFVSGEPGRSGPIKGIYQDLFL